MTPFYPPGAFDRAVEKAVHDAVRRLRWLFAQLLTAAFALGVLAGWIAHALWGAAFYRWLGVLALVLGVSGSAFAQDVKRPKLFTAVLIAQAAGQTMDGISTVIALRTPGTVEANPMLKFAQGSASGMVATKVAMAAGSTWLLQRVSKDHPRVAFVMGSAVAAVSWSAAAHNLRGAKR